MNYREQLIKDSGINKKQVLTEYGFAEYFRLLLVCAESKLAELQEKYEEEVIQSALWSANYSTLKKSIEESTHSRFRIADWLDREGPPDNWFEEKLYALVEVEK